MANLTTFRCPIHGDIRVEKWAKDLIDCAEFQRLRNIKQLGGASMVFMGATHTRFQHSIGVYKIISIIVNNVEGNKKISDKAKREVLAAGLLHDIGHGPLSHALEIITDGKICHEKFSQEIICGDTQINKVLKKNKIDPKAVASIIEGTHKDKRLVSIISSQVDADRMDYLLRDSYYTGTTYGNFDLNRILKSMIITDDEILFNESGVPAIENFLLSRYHSFTQIYNHRISISYEAGYKAILKRVVDISKDIKVPHGDIIVKIMSGKISLDEFLMLDDNTFHEITKSLINVEDKMLKDLCQRVIGRKLFKVEKHSAKKEKLIKEKISKAKLDEKYYFDIIEVKNSAYKKVKIKEKGINVMCQDSGKKMELHKVSKLAETLIGASHEEDYMIFPKEFDEKQD